MHLPVSSEASAMRNVLYDMSTNSADSSSGKSRTCVNLVKCWIVKDTNPCFSKHNNHSKTYIKHTVLSNGQKVIMYLHSYSIIIIMPISHSYFNGKWITRTPTLLTTIIITPFFRLSMPYLLQVAVFSPNALSLLIMKVSGPVHSKKQK